MGGSLSKLCLTNPSLKIEISSIVDCCFIINLTELKFLSAYLDRLCGITSQTDIHFSLAYNLEQQVDANKIIDVQQHTTPLYNVEAIRYRQEVLQTNGENNTYHAGAYLFDGLHEGAISSAFVVSELLDGKHL